MCEGLKPTGVAGRPEEYFEALPDTGRPRAPADFLAGLEDSRHRRDLLGQPSRADHRPVPHRNGMMGLAHRGWALHDSSHHIVDRLREGGYHSDLIGEQRVSRDPGGARLRRGSRHHQQPRRHRGAAGRLPPRVRDPPNCGDGPTKDELIAMGWPSWGAEREQLCDLRFDPNEMHNLIADPRWSQVADELRTRLELWMCETDDPLLDGPVELPPEARVNSPVQRSAADPPAVQASAA